MRNHCEKNKDMAESVLPSKRRQSAHTSRQIAHRRERTRVRDRLDALRRSVRWLDTDEWDLAEAELSYEGQLTQDLADMVERRRSLDKVAPLIRWACVHIQRDPELRDASLAEQVHAFACQLPNNLIGRHAVDHIEGELSWRHNRSGWLARKNEPASRHTDRRAEEIRWLVEHGYHQAINDGMRAAMRREGSQYVTSLDRGHSETSARSHLRTSWRPLAGLHDIEAFHDATRSSIGVSEVIDQLLSASR